MQNTGVILRTALLSFPPLRFQAWFTEVKQTEQMETDLGVELYPRRFFKQLTTEWNKHR